MARAGVWTTEQARRFLEHTKALGGEIAAAELMNELMGTTVLDSGVPVRPGLHTYAHCLRGTPGGVALLVINTDRVEIDLE